MAFWKNVDNELVYRGMSRKELSFLSGVSISVINKGMQRDSDVMAETALRIANTLDISLEHLLDLPEKQGGQPDEEINISRADILLYYRYQQCIADFETLPGDEKNAMLNLISVMAKKQRA